MIGSEMQSSKSSGGGKYAVFVCEVVTGIKTWRQRRRFREFVKLDREIVKLIAESNDPTLKDVWLPIMPPKSLTKSSDDPDLVRLRCVKLEEYLRNLVELNFIWDLPVLMHHMINCFDDIFPSSFFFFLANELFLR
jgi:hypothetical protein